MIEHLEIGVLRIGARGYNEIERNILFRLFARQHNPGRLCVGVFHSQMSGVHIGGDGTHLSVVGEGGHSPRDIIGRTVDV
jgi:hypothetical protein